MEEGELKEDRLSRKKRKLKRKFLRGEVVD